MRVIIATVQVPFVRGGAEIASEELRNALHVHGVEAEIVSIPFTWYPPKRLPEQMLACRLLDVTASCGQKVDRLIGLKFPAYLIPHPNKVLWLLHQHRQAYDLWGTPYSDLAQHVDGPGIRQAIWQADSRLPTESMAVYTISQTVSARLQVYNGIQSTPLYHPPRHAARYFCGSDQGYCFFPSRINAMKRQELVIRALACTRNSVRIHFAGRADEHHYGHGLMSLAEQLRVHDRVCWLGEITEEEKRSSYARARAVVYTPEDEDLGYVTLEAMLASKPVVTCRDSGGPLEFVSHGETGYTAAPTPEALAETLDAIWADQRRAAEMGRNGRRKYEKLGISWSQVVRRLIA